VRDVHEHGRGCGTGGRRRGDAIVRISLYGAAARGKERGRGTLEGTARKMHGGEGDGRHGRTKENTEITIMRRVFENDSGSKNGRPVPANYFHGLPVCFSPRYHKCRACVHNVIMRIKGRVLEITTTTIMSK